MSSSRDPGDLRVNDVILPAIDLCVKVGGRGEGGGGGGGGVTMIFTHDVFDFCTRNIYTKELVKVTHR